MCSFLNAHRQSISEATPGRISCSFSLFLFPWLLTAVSSSQPVRGQDLLQGPELETSASVQHLLRTAEDAVSREDWKLAIDSLQRVIDAPAGLLPASADEAGAFDGVARSAPVRETILYESPRRYALGRLASLPEAGLSAYRVLYDGRAKGLMERARREMDVDAAWTVCKRYSMTRYGGEAVDFVSSWLLDVGRPSRALALIEEFLALRPEGGSVAMRLHLKKSAALGLMGDGDAARSALDQVETMGGSEEWLERAVAAVEALVDEGGAVGAGSDPLREWSGPMGGGACTGVMDAVVPSFAEKLPWRREIPSLIPGVWPELEGVGTYSLPTMQPVASDGRLYVKAGRECMALDLQSFAVLWKSPSPVQGISERVRTDESLGLGSEGAVLVDYIGHSLSVGGGVVLSVERGDRGPTFDRDGVAVVQRRRRPRSDSWVETANRLVAYDARTGALRWERGRRSDPDERLRDAAFLAPGVVYEELAWVPFADSGDLYIGAFEINGGALSHRIPLCTLAGREVNPIVALFPAASDGFLYVPTGFGLFFAVDMRTQQVVWAHRYASSSPPPQHRQRGIPQPRVPRHWLSGPPVLAGRLALLAPTDEDSLLALDRVTGELAWRLPRSKHQYIIAAEGGRVWLGGEVMGAVSLRDGSYVWSVNVPPATGRAVLCGETIYLPAGDSLIAMDAGTGEYSNAYDLPYDQPRLGNLLCIAGSMVSLDPNEVRAFPDRDSYEATLAAHRANPADPRIAIRLAFIELLEDRPQRALDALGGVEITDAQDRALQLAHVSHLRVRALMQLAAAPETAGGDSIAYLEKAVSVSQDERDMVAARLALGDKLRQLGRYAESYRTLWRLAVEPLGDEMVMKDGVRRPARMLISDTLARIEPELAPLEIEQLVEEAGVILSDAVEKLDRRSTRLEGIAALERLAGSGPLAGMHQRALNTLGRHELDRGRYEPAEQYFAESLRRGTDRRETAAAGLALVDLYVSPDQGLFKSAAELIERLSVEDGEVVVDGEPVRAQLQARAARIDQSLAGEHAAALDVGMFEIGAEGVEEWPAADLPSYARLVHTRPERTEATAGRQLVFIAPRTLRSYDLDTGVLEWETQLLTRNFSLEPELGESEGTLVGGGSRWAALDGQTAIMNGPEGLHAVGVISGKRLWARPIGSAALLRDPVVREQTMDVGDGRLACVLSPGTLSVLRVRDGGMEWERQLEREAAFVHVRDGVVLTADANLGEIEVFGLQNGSRLSSNRFQQPSAEAAPALVPVAYSEGVLCGPSRGGVIAYDVRTGDRVWSLDLVEGAAALFELTKGRLVIATRGGDHKVVDARTGEVLFSERIVEMPGGAVFGAVEEEFLVLAGYEETRQGDRWTLTGMDLSSGKKLWSRELLALMNRSHLRLAEGVIPLVTTAVDQAEDGSRRGSVDGQQIRLIDKRTGRDVGRPIDWTGIRGGNRLVGDMEVWPERLVLQAREGIVVFRTRAASRSDSGVN